MTSAAQILSMKGDATVLTTTPATPVVEAIMQMVAHNVGALVVKDGEAVVGVVSERDYARKVGPVHGSSKQTTVRDIMSSHVMYVSPTHSVEECMALMTDKRVRHLPVMEKGRLLGVISIGDLVKHVISEQRFIIEQLEHYISGQGG